MPAQKSEIVGEEKVAAAFDALARKAADATEVTREVSAIGVDAARNAAPVLTGALVASISAETGQNTAELGSDIGYAPFNEFGTTFMPGVRFMAAGYEAMHDRAEQIATTWAEGVLSDVERMG